MKLKPFLLCCLVSSLWACAEPSSTPTNNADANKEMKDRVCAHPENAHCTTACSCLPITTQNAQSCGGAYAMCIQDVAA